MFTLLRSAPLYTCYPGAIIIAPPNTIKDVQVWVISYMIKLKCDCQNTPLHIFKENPNIYLCRIDKISLKQEPKSLHHLLHRNGYHVTLQFRLLDNHRPGVCPWNDRGLGVRNKIILREVGISIGQFENKRNREKETVRAQLKTMERSHPFECLSVGKVTIGHGTLKGDFLKVTFIPNSQSL